MNEATVTVVLKNKYGMHVRPAGLFAKTAARYRADVTVEKDGIVVPGKSIMALMTLEAVNGTSLTIRATGEEAQTAVKELEALVERKFDLHDEKSRSGGWQPPEGWCLLRPFGLRPKRNVRHRGTPWRPLRPMLKSLVSTWRWTGLAVS